MRVDGVLDGTKTVVVTLGTHHVILHKIGKAAVLIGMQTIVGTNTSVFISVQMIGEIPTAHTGCVLFAVRRFLGYKATAFGV